MVLVCTLLFNELKTKLFVHSVESASPNFTFSGKIYAPEAMIKIPKAIKKTDSILIKMYMTFFRS